MELYPNYIDSSTTNSSGEIKFFNKRSPNEIPWEDHGIDIVLECTGIFTKAEDAKKECEPLKIIPTLSKDSYIWVKKD